MTQLTLALQPRRVPARQLPATEKRDLMPGDRHTWECIAGHRPLDARIVPMSSEAARQAFLLRFSELKCEAVDL